MALAALGVMNFHEAIVRFLTWPADVLTIGATTFHPLMVLFLTLFENFPIGFLTGSAMFQTYLAPFLAPLMT